MASGGVHTHSHKHAYTCTKVFLRKQVHSTCSWRAPGFKKLNFKGEWGSKMQKVRKQDKILAIVNTATKLFYGVWNFVKPYDFISIPTIQYYRTV